MKLKDFIRLHKDDEVEVWDKQIDIRCPYYAYGDYSYGDSEDEDDLWKIENWLWDLEVSNVHGSSCCVDVFSQMENNISLFKDMYYEDDEEELVCLATEDVFTTLSQGFYGFANQFVTRMKL